MIRKTGFESQTVTKGRRVIMKFSSIRDYRTLISRSFALLAVIFLLMAMLTPDVVGQVIAQQPINDSPLGIARVVEHAVANLLN